MRIDKQNRKHVIAALGLGAAAAALTLLLPAAAQAGRGGSPAKIASAIRSGSTDAIAAELERAEFLVCATCTDYVRPLVDHPEYKVREVAAWWLVRRGVSRQIMTEMITRLSQPDSVKARNAADVLGQFRSPAAITALGAALSNPVYSPEARTAMARALATIGRVEARPALVTALGDAQAPVRAASLEALRALVGAGQATEAVPLLADGDAAVRTQAIFLVASSRTQAGAAGLVTILESDQDPAVRKRAAWALGELRASYAVAGPALVRAANGDASPLVRSLAQAAASKLTR